MPSLTSFQHLFLKNLLISTSFLKIWVDLGQKLIKVPEILDFPCIEEVMHITNLTQIRVGFTCISGH